MEVSEVIEKLSQYDSNTDVLFEDKVLDSILSLSNIELIQTYDKDFVLLSADYGAQEEVLLDE